MSILTDTNFLLQLSLLDKFKKVRDYLWNFRCPHRDSQRNKKNRGYVFRKKSDLYYKCHNCNMGQSVGNLIKDIDPHLTKNTFYIDINLVRQVEVKVDNQSLSLNSQSSNQEKQLYIYLLSVVYQENTILQKVL